jgi:glutaredoxin 3
VEKNVREDKDALKDLLDRGFQSTPVTLIDDEAVIGFDQARIDALLEL